jgi:hypothetical protein
LVAFLDRVYFKHNNNGKQVNKKFDQRISGPN